jgi:hypothetical protein
VWPAQPAQRRPFSVFVLAEFSNLKKKKKNLNTSARFSQGLFFSLFRRNPRKFGDRKPAPKLKIPKITFSAQPSKFLPPNGRSGPFMPLVAVLASVH